MCLDLTWNTSLVYPSLSALELFFKGQKMFLFLVDIWLWAFLPTGCCGQGPLRFCWLLRPKNRGIAQVKWQRFKTKWGEAFPVSSDAPCAGTWLAERHEPEWGIGCKVCHLAKVESPFGQFQIRSPAALQRVNFQKHMNNANCRKAVKLFLSGEVVETGLNLAPSFSDFESLLAQKPWNDRLCSFSAQLRHRRSNCAWLLRPPRMKVIPSDDQSRLFCHFAYETRKVLMKKYGFTEVLHIAHCCRNALLFPICPPARIWTSAACHSWVRCPQDSARDTIGTLPERAPHGNRTARQNSGCYLRFQWSTQRRLPGSLQRLKIFGWNPRRPERFSWGRMRDMWLGWWSFEVACMAPVPTLQVCEITHMHSPRDP